jgi:glucosamine kinase
MTGRLLGLDGGGTKTIAVLADTTGNVLACETSEGLDPTSGPAWEASLTAIANRTGPADAAVLGLPYHGEIPAISVRQTSLGKALFGANCQVVNDVAVAFEGALAGENGVLILSGTGSMAWARGPAGTVRVGGWGDAFGDEGSACWIGREALAVVSRHLDGRQSCRDFTEAMLRHLGEADDGLIAWTYGQPNRRAAIASVAREVSALADANVPEAKSIMHAAAEHLAEQGRTAARRSGVIAPIRWSIAGSVMQDATLRRALMKAMGGLPLPPRLPPVGGAILAAAHHAGMAVDAGFADRLADGLAGALGSTGELMHAVTP